MLLGPHSEYLCPAYVTSQRGDRLHKTKLASNFLLNVPLRLGRDRNSDHCALQGVAALLQTDY